MCLILFSYKQHPKYPLVLIANRDEFYERPTSPADWWEDHPNVLAGRDLQAGGTWMGITKGGRFAAITNYREFPRNGDFPTSRGALVKDFLTTDVDPTTYMQQLQHNGEDYEGYNLLFGTVNDLHYFSNKGAHIDHLPAELYGLSNHLIDTPWPKVVKGKHALEQLLLGDQLNNDLLLDLMTDTEQAEDGLLPDTGIGEEWEQKLSSLFIETDKYGTRCTTLLLIDNHDKVTFTERGFVPEVEQHFSFQIGT